MPAPTRTNPRSEPVPAASAGLTVAADAAMQAGSAIPASGDEPAVREFSESARDALLNLRRAVADVLATFPSLDRPVRLAERLGLDTSLAWKIWKVALGDGAVPAASHLPGSAAFERFIAAAEQAGAPRSRTHQAAAAYATLNELLEAHAGDRASGVIMLGFLSEAGRTRTELAMRRAAFRANAHFLGVQARTLYQLDVLARPRGDRAGATPMVVRLRAHFGLTRTRAGVAWMLGRSTQVQPAGPTQVRRRPLTGTTGAHPDESPWLVRAFSSSPVPTVLRRTVAGVTTEDELAPGPVGQTGAVDVVLGELIDERPAPSGPVDAMTMCVSTPAEGLCYDVMIEDGLIDGDVRSRVHSTVHGDLPYLRGDHCDVIPTLEAFRLLGPAATVQSPVEVPRFREMLSWVLGAAGVNVDRLRAWRLQMKLPPVPSRAAAVFTLAGQTR